ncbi:MAG: hypothetical protein J7M19_10490, partial [Planctomycetes bacterium]|nr:hypothetical protein [Planctomycetota bacterium]
MVLEALEERIAPTIVVVGSQISWADSNGDGITVEYSGPAGSFVNVLNAAGGDIGLASTGSLSGAEVVLPGDLAGVKAGSVTDSTILAGGDIGAVQANLIYGSHIRAEGMLEKVLIGSAGMMDSNLTGIGGIGTFISRGSVVGSTLSSLDDPNPGVTPLGGGAIGSLRAGELHGVTVEALKGFGSIKVTGAVSDTTFDAWHSDAALGYDVGGDLGSFSTRALVGSSVEVLGNVGAAKIANPGIIGASHINVGGNLAALQVRGGISDASEIHVADSLT